MKESTLNKWKLFYLNVDEAKQVLMRDLTEEEEQIIMNDGLAALYEDLGINEDSIAKMNAIRNYISLYFTGTERDFEHARTEEIQNILKDLLEPFKESKKEKSVEDIVEDLKKGEKFTLNCDMIEKVSDYISNNLTNYIFKVTNNEVSLRMLK